MVLNNKDFCLSHKPAEPAVCMSSPFIPLSPLFTIHQCHSELMMMTWARSQSVGVDATSETGPVICGCGDVNLSVGWIRNLKPGLKSDDRITLEWGWGRHWAASLIHSLSTATEERITPVVHCYVLASAM